MNEYGNGTRQTEGEMDIEIDIEIRQRRLGEHTMIVVVMVYGGSIGHIDTGSDGLADSFRIMCVCVCWGSSMCDVMMKLNYE